MKKLIENMPKGLNRFAQFLTRTAIAVVLLTSFSVSVTAQSLDNKGKDFITAIQPNFDSAVTIELHLTSDVATMVTVHYPVNAPTFTTTVAVNPGAITIVTLPIATSTAWVNNIPQNNCVRAFAAEEFVCYTVNRRSFSSDAALALPIETMNTAYIVLDYDPTFAPNRFHVVAAFDGTTVTITPRVAITGHAAGVPFNVVLNRGQGYQGTSLSTFGLSGSLSGTIIESDRPVGVVNGSGCHQVPTGVAACDHTYEVAQPVASWGKEVLVANLPNRPGGSLYRIMASQDGTTLNMDGAFLALLNKGQFATTSPIAGNHRFSADKPIFVAQFMTSVDSPGAVLGDPAMGNMIPSEQYLNKYTFSTVGGGQFVQNFVSVIAPNTDIGLVLLDGVAIPGGSYSAIPGSTFSAAIVALNSGTHNTVSPHPHGITVEGYNSADSYLYPGGALFQFINPVGDANAPICASTQLAGPPPSVCGSATDNRPSEDVNNSGVLDPGEDLNGNGQIDKDTGIFFVQLAPGAVNLTLTVTPFTPGDGSVTYCVTLTNPNLDGTGDVVATDGAGNQCRTPINLSVNQPPTVGSTCVAIASGKIVTLAASDDHTATANIKIFVRDSATPAFIAGPYKAGDVLVVRTNPAQPPYSRALTGAYKAQIQVKGQALLVAEDGDGSTSAPKPICR